MIKKSSNNTDLVVSVIVCAYNGSNIIELCLKGLIQQTLPPNKFEIIIIDDGSSDNTYEVVSNFINKNKGHEIFMELNSIKHGGLSIARNAGIQLSKGEIIAFIDQDAVPDANWINELANTFNSGADYVGGRINLLNTETWVARFLQQTRFIQFFGTHTLNHPIGCNMAFRKRIFDLAKGFHENFTSYGDESTLNERIKDKFLYSGSPNAIVLHQQPDTFIRIVQMEWKSGMLSRLVAKASGKKMNWKYMIFIVEQFFISLFPVFICLNWLSLTNWWIPSAIAVLIIIRRFYLQFINREILKGLIIKHGFFRGFLSHFLFYFFKTFLHFFGRIAGIWKYHSVEIIHPNTTPLSILKSTNSYSRTIEK
jgi:glycosyltransferase involved in cell wall biosynthesis